MRCLGYGMDNSGFTSTHGVLLGEGAISLMVKQRRRQGNHKSPPSAEVEPHHHPLPTPRTPSWRPYEQLYLYESNEGLLANFSADR
jgi:hypothetical protein